MNNTIDNFVPDFKPEPRSMRIEISKGITQKDAIRVLEKINLAISGNATSWDTESNNFVVLLEKETDSDDGICVAKQITWHDIKRKIGKDFNSFNSKPMRDRVDSTGPIPKDESAIDEEYRWLNQGIPAA